MVAMTETMPTPAGPTWKVLSQTPQLVKNAQGVYVDGYRVTAQLPAGPTFFVDVPKADYSVDRVQAELRAEASTVLGVHQLTS